MSDRELALELFKEIVKNKSVDAYFDILKEIEETQTETFKGRLQEIYNDFKFYSSDGVCLRDYERFVDKIDKLLKGDSDE